MPIDFYRQEVINRNRSMGVKRNYFCSEFWAQVKRDYEALPINELNRHEEASRRSVGAARATRNMLRDHAASGGDDAAPPVGVPPAEVVNVEDDEGGPICGVCCARSCQRPHALPKLSLTSDEKFAFGVSQAGLADGTFTGLPFGANHLEQLLFEGGTRTKLEHQFQQMVSRPSLDRGVVPEKVVRHSHCGAICQTRASPPVVVMQKLLCEKIAKYIRSLGKGVMANKELFFEFEVHEQLGTVRSSYVLLCEGVAQAGIIHPQESYVLLDGYLPPDVMDREVDAVACVSLAAFREEFVRQESMPFECSEGIFGHLTTDELTSTLVTSDVSDQVPVNAVVLHRLHVSDNGAGHWKVVKTDKAILRVALADAEQAAAAHDGGEGSGDDDAFVNRKRPGPAVHPEMAGPEPHEEKSLQDMGDWLAADIASLLIDESELEVVLGELSRNDPNIEVDSASDLDDDDRQPPAAAAANAAPAGVVDASPVKWEDAMDTLLMVDDCAAVYQRFGLEKTAESDVQAIGDPEKTLGRLYFSWGTTLSAACRNPAHKGCKCLIRLSDVPPHRVEGDLVKWLAFGQTVGQDAHIDAAAIIKTKNGMRVRGVGL